MTDQSDDLEAVRIIVAALQAFEEKDQERIIRWSREKLGLSAHVATNPPTPPAHTPSDIHHESRNTDIKTFVESKNPPNDVQFAATIAYYYRFEAPESERKETITSADLQEACRKSNRKRLNDPGTTLNNAHKLGLLDKGSERGNFGINSVGENLVAMTLPQQASTVTIVSRQKPKRKASVKIIKKKANST
jgi:hypothetical protein